MFVRKRWVDGGHNAKGVRIASSEGISCSIDCTLWFLSERVGMTEAVTVATTMGCDWKFAKIDVTQGVLVQWKGENCGAKQAHGKSRPQCFGLNNPGVCSRRGLVAQQASATVIFQISANHR